MNRGYFEKQIRTLQKRVEHLIWYRDLVENIFAFYERENAGNWEVPLPVQYRENMAALIKKTTLVASGGKC